VTSNHRTLTFLFLLLPITLFAQEVKIVGPSEAVLKQPIQLLTVGLPSNDTCTTLWRIFPESKDDVWIEMYDRNGTPINIYWSLVAGTKTFTLIVATNNTGGPPTLNLYEHKVNYGGSVPVPVPPVPVPPVPGPPEPTPNLKQAVASLTEYKLDISTKDRENLIEFYSDFASVVAQTGTLTNSQLRDSYVEAGKLFFEDTGIRGKYAGLPEIIDGILAEQIGLEVKSIDPVTTGKIFEAISWAFWKGGQK